MYLRNGPVNFTLLKSNNINNNNNITADATKLTNQKGIKFNLKSKNNQGNADNRNLVDSNILAGTIASKNEKKGRT